MTLTQQKAPSGGPGEVSEAAATAASPARNKRRGLGRLLRWVPVPVWRAKKGVRSEPAWGPGDEEDPGVDDGEASADQVERTLQIADLLPEPEGAANRPNSRKAARGVYFPRTEGALTTTRQGQILNTALLAAPTDDEGIVNGRDKLTNAPVAHDPFTAYRKKIVTSPHVIVLGVIGSGKSSLIKTVYVLRPLILKQRRAVVVDRKDQDGQGEYADLTRRFGSEPYRFVIGGGGTTISPLDPRILGVIGASGQLRLLNSMAAAARQHSTGRDIEWEEKMMRVAYYATQKRAEDLGRVPVLDDLVPLLGNVDLLDPAERQGYSAAALERLHEAGSTVRFSLEQTLSDELAGLFNGETSKDVNLKSRLTTFDISQLPYDGPATAMVLAVVNTWLLGTLRKERGMGTNFVVEEGWDMMTGPIARYLNSFAFLARGLGLANVAAMHHVAQAANSPEGMTLLREPQTVHLYRQDREEDIQACVRTYGLEQQSQDTLRNLDQGEHLLKIGKRPEVWIQHTRSPLEIDLTYTDSAMEMRRLGEAS